MKPILETTDAMRIRLRQFLRCYALALAMTFSITATSAENTFRTTSVDHGAGATTTLQHWEIQSSAKSQNGGAEVSSGDFSTKEWFAVSGRATVMAGLLENGKYPDLFYGDNLRAVEIPDASGNQIVVPWWYRTQFTLAKGARGSHTLLRMNGLIASADVWLNGHLVADRASVVGAYPVYEFDVTSIVREGANTLALRVHPADLQRALVIGWVDWNPMPPDNNMGPWRGVDIVQTGPVQLRFPQVISALSLPDLKRAALTVKAELRNLDVVPHDVSVTGDVAGISLQQSVHLDAGQTRTIEFSPRTNSGLEVDHPKVWWPVGMGEHPLHPLQLTATVDGALSDRASVTFGIRDVSSRLTKQGHRQFLINGKPVLIRGAGWAPDIFLRDDAKRMDAEFSYVLNLGLNTIRTEGKLENQRFYDLADQLGIMILPGWECCDKWEAWALTGGETWDDADRHVAETSMASEARLLRNHPSVIGFIIGSDNAPPPTIGKKYIDILRAADWQTPIIAAASKREATDAPVTINESPAVPKTAGTGVVAEAYPSGMKMDGPYDWVPPSYWYGDQFGGAFGFDSEVSAGATIPRLEDVTRMLSPQEQDALWMYPKVRQYHAAESWSTFATLEPFDVALAKRYGKPKDLADYVAKAQLENYDNVRAQFEAFNAHVDAANPSTGVIYWMLNNAWPSLHWHLYDYYLNPAGAYFGAKKANEPVHIQYSYDTRAIMLVNHTATGSHGLKARVRVRDIDGGVRYDKHFQGVDVAGNRTLQLTALPQLTGLSGTYFVELNLESKEDQLISRNVYWLSAQQDVLDWTKSTWYLTPVSQYADLTALQSLPTATSEIRASTRREGSDNVTSVTLSVAESAKNLALFQHLSIRRSADAELALPIVWSDNDVTLWPGESLTVTARYATQESDAPVLEVSGWNTPVKHIPITAEKLAASSPGANH
jgi:exo-1,4-beta-D-glucosaminidase